MATSVFIDLLFIIILLGGFYAAYRAGWNDGRRWERLRAKHAYCNRSIQMDHTHGGDDDDL